VVVFLFLVVFILLDIMYITHTPSVKNGGAVIFKQVLLRDWI
jgi:hypothetical protein